MDENNVPQDNWLEELMSISEIEDDILFPASESEPKPAPKPEFDIAPDEPELADLFAEDATRTLPDISEMETPEETPEETELDRIIREISDIELEVERAIEPQPEPETEAFKDDDFRDAFGEGEELIQFFTGGGMPTISAPEPEPEKEPEPAAAPPEEIEEGPMEKGRPKRKKGYGLFGLPHLAATAVWIAIIVTIGISVGRLIWLCASDVLALGREPINATITIEKGDDMDDIAQKLKEAGLIKYPGIFKLYADFTDAQEKIKPGTYSFIAVNEFNQNIVYDYMALVAVMSPSSNRLVIVEDLRIPEGYTCAQIFKLLEEKRVCTVAEMEAYVASLSLPENEDEEPNPLTQYWFLDGVTWGHKYSLEGYLFPDTYDFYENDDPERVLKKMLDAFDVAFTDIMKANWDKVEGYTFHEIITIASMIEKEAANASESYLISGVIFNRLKNPAEYPKLEIDATIVYALGGKADLTKEDLEIDSPYNTRLYPGLPPGPIASPSQNSIAAALTPDDAVDEESGKPYYFYLLDPRVNEHKFSTSREEHEAFKEFVESLKEAE